MNKGINIIDKHVEKVILAFAGVLVLAILAMQFLLQPSAVEVDGTRISPGEATEAVEDLAERKRGEMRSATSVADEVPEVTLFGTELVASAETSATNGAWLSALGARPAGSVDDAGSTGETSPSDPADDQDYQLPTIPMPQVVAASQYAGTIDPVVPLLYEDAATYLPQSQPFDKFYVTVEGTFSASEWRANIDAVSPEFAMPLSWTSEVELLQVVMFRERFTEDGVWGERTAITSLPGRFTLQERLDKEDVLPFELQQIEADEEQFRSEIRRPAFYNVISGPLWTRPSDSTADGVDPETQEQLDDLLNTLARIDNRISNFQRRIDDFEEEFGEQWRERDPPGGGDDRDRDRDRDDSAAMKIDDIENIVWPAVPRSWLAQSGGGGGGSGGNDIRNDPSRSEVSRYRRNLSQLDEQRVLRAELIEQLAELGFTETGQPIPMNDEEAFQNYSLADESADEITIWAHDITASPGQQYRYALGVRLTNPFFANRNALSQSQRAMAEQPFVDSEISDWSAAVGLPEPTVFFVEGARPLGLNPLGGISESTVSTNAFAFYYGYWRGGENVFRIGDRIDFDVDLPEFPIFELELDDQGVPQVIGQETLEETRTQFLSAYFIADIVRDAAVEISVFFRERGGAITRRNALTDRVSALRARVLESARLSEDAVIRQPLDEAIIPGAPPEPDGRDDRDDDRRGPGGSGGGGFLG